MVQPCQDRCSHNNLVVWATAKYTGRHDVRPADIEMYDIGTGIYRRVTMRESNLRPRGIHFPYLLLMDVRVTSPIQLEDYYLVNLIEVGITDEFGSLIPGVAVLEPPTGPLKSSRPSPAPGM